MSEPTISALISLCTGIVLLIIEYYIIKPTKSKNANLLKVDTPSKGEPENYQSKQLQTKISWLFSGGTLPQTLRIFLIIILSISGIFLTIEALVYTLRLFRVPFSVTEHVPIPVDWLFFPLKASIGIVLGSSFLRGAFNLLGEKAVYSIFNNILNTILFICVATVSFCVVVFGTTLSLIIFEISNGYIGVINSLAGLFFCIYVSVSMYPNVKRLFRTTIW